MVETEAARLAGQPRLDVGRQRGLTGFSRRGRSRGRSGVRTGGRTTPHRGRNGASRGRPVTPASR